MSGQLRAKHNLWGWALVALVFLWASQVGVGSEPSLRVGTLHLEGEGIERLVLQDSTGLLKVFYYREPSLVLPEGSYRLHEVFLQGGYSCLWPQIPAAARVVRIGPGTFINVKLGAPLRQTVRVERWGRSLVLNHQLLGRGGESYSVTQHQASQPPAFVIYRGERKLASGTFEPG